jgi:hypothetical protein
MWENDNKEKKVQIIFRAKKADDRESPALLVN